MHENQARPSASSALGWLASALAILLLSGASVAHAADPMPFSAEYEVLRKGKPEGRADVSLRRDGEHWVLETRTRGTAGMASLAGLEIDERSRFVLNHGAPEAREYRYSQKALMRSRKRSLDVDVATRSILSRDRDRRHELDYQPGVIDRNLVVLALAHRLQNESELALLVADRARVDLQSYRLVDREIIRVPEGEHRAAHLSRTREAGDDRQTEYWIDERRGISLRLLQTEEDGDQLELRLIKYTPGG